MFNLRANYLTDVNILEWNLPGAMPDTQRSFTGQTFTSFFLNGGHMEATKGWRYNLYLMARSFCVFLSDETPRSTLEVPIPLSLWSFPPPALSNENN